MKKLALAAALCAAFTGSAFAQSSVTLYGRVNTSVEFQDNGQTDRTVMENNASRWGLKGNEDLGGGLSAFFMLETGFGSDTGAGSGGFNREAFVGLKSASFGQIKAGKITSALYYATLDWIGFVNHDTGTSAEDKLYTLNFTSNNAVEYTTPTFGGGFTVALTVNAGEGADATGTNVEPNLYSKTYEGVVSYDVENLHVGAGYSKSENVAGDDVIEGFSAAGAYTMGPLTVGLAYEYNDSTALGKRNHYHVTAMYAVGAHEFHGVVGYADEWDNVADSDAKVYTVGYGYNLSKRTKLYAFYTLNDNGTVPYGAGYSSLAVLPNEDWSSFAVGIRHHF
ncbi:porin [Methylibium sp.]|uniref:porin n=1 Tax=Methylibium sp. TaxID=2067992 RepID=UPI0033401C62